MASNASSNLLKWPGASPEAVDEAAAMVQVGALVGRLVAIDAGHPTVEFDAGQGPCQMPARVLQDMARGGPPWAVGQTVLLMLERGEAALPVIVGRVGDTLPQASVEMRANELNLEGHEQVVLRCGEASITLKADGQVLIKGSRLLSRASESNKIRGATVLIN